jgi:hypothetical protein
LCVIDAVFSIGVRYRNVQNVVEAWCVAQTPTWPKFSTTTQARHTITDLIGVTNGCVGIDLAGKFFGGNRQRTSPRGGILKADAVVQFAKALQQAGVDDFPISETPPALTAQRRPFAPFQDSEAVYRLIIC